MLLNVQPFPNITRPLVNNLVPIVLFNCASNFNCASYVNCASYFKSMNDSKATVKQRENKGDPVLFPIWIYWLYHCTGYRFMVSPSEHLILFIKKVPVFFWVTYQRCALVPIKIVDISMKHSKICIFPFSSFNNVI